MKNTIDAEYPLPPAGGIVPRILQSQRRKMSDAFGNFSKAGPGDSVLHVHLAPSALPHRPADESAALDIDGARLSSYEVDLPHSNVRRTGGNDRPHDAVHLPFADGQFDWTYCSEVIEHVGGFERQYALVKELARVSRRGVFLTTSNRRHPLEFNTGLPLLHWLPRAWWRKTLKWLGKSAWASDASLHLVDSKALYKFAMLLPGKPKHDVGHKRVFGLKAHFFLMIEKGNSGDKSERKTSDAGTTA